MEITKVQMMVDEIMDNFDFHKVKDIMEYLNWKIFIDSGFQIPDESELRMNARKLIYSTIKNSNNSKEEFVWSQTGPFKVICFRDEIGITDIFLEMVTSNWSVNINDISE